MAQDTDTLKVKKESVMFWSKVAFAILGAGGITFGSAKLAVQSEAPKAEVVNEAASDMKGIKAELGEIKVLLKNNDLEKAALQRELSDLRSEVRELRTNDKEQDKIIAKLVAEGKK